MSIGTSTLIGTSTGRRLIAPVTAPTGLATAADIAQVAAATGPGTAAIIVRAGAAIAVEATAADTEAEAAGATADSPTGIGRGGQPS
jgi:hypothetical protein